MTDRRKVLKIFSMKHLLLLTVIVVSCSLAQAQLEGTITTGRPGQAIGGGVVGTGVFQIQSGIDVVTNQQTGIERTNHTLNNIVRLGLTERFEISTILDYSQDTVETNNLTQDFDGISQWQLGFRYNLIPSGEGWLPVLGLQTRFRMRAVSSEYRRNELAPVFMLSAVKALDEQWTVTGNYGVSYDGFTPMPTYNWVLSVSKSWGSRWSTVAEFYGSESNTEVSTFYGAGLAYLVNNDLQLDTYLSTGENRGIETFYGTVGVSWRTLAFLQGDTLFN